jgi:hypothetical protein
LVSRAEAVRVEEAHASREKGQAGKAGLVAAELTKLHEYLLAPLRVRAQPATPAQAIGSYRAARRQETPAELPGTRAAEQAVSPALR